MEKLKQGDYVTNLTKEQFDELMKYQTESYGRYYFTNENNNAVFEGDYISVFLENHECKTKLPFEVFKERAINTFKG